MPMYSVIIKQVIIKCLVIEIMKHRKVVYFVFQKSYYKFYLGGQAQVYFLLKIERKLSMFLNGQGTMHCSILINFTGILKIAYDFHYRGLG